MSAPPFDYAATPVEGVCDNCTPDETRVDAHGLVHDWAMVGEDRYGSHYECRRCHVQDVD